MSTEKLLEGLNQEDPTLRLYKRVDDILVQFCHLNIAAPTERRALASAIACELIAEPPADLAKCPRCSTEYRIEVNSGIRLCRKCGGPVDAHGNNS